MQSYTQPDVEEGPKLRGSKKFVPKWAGLNMLNVIDVFMVYFVFFV